MKPTDPSFQLKGLVEPEPYLPRHAMPVWGWFALSGGVVLIALLAILALRMMRKTKKEAVEDVRESSYREALAALASASHERIQEVATTVSSALRRYLARVSADPALYETHEEFIGRHHVLTRYPDNLRQAAADTFSELARLKYGREASGDPEHLISGARNLLDQFHAVVLPQSPA